MVKATDKVLITDRVLKDNSYQFTETEIHAQLEKDLQCRVIIIPEYPKELTGHADGLIRFIDDTTVFISVIRHEPDKNWLPRIPWHFKGKQPYCSRTLLPHGPEATHG